MNSERSAATGFYQGYQGSNGISSSSVPFPSLPLPPRLPHFPIAQYFKLLPIHMALPLLHNKLSNLLKNPVLKILKEVVLRDRRLPGKKRKEPPTTTPTRLPPPSSSSSSATAFATTTATIVPPTSSASSSAAAAATAVISLPPPTLSSTPTPFEESVAVADTANAAGAVYLLPMAKLGLPQYLHHFCNCRLA
ncbi:hypothetical protein BDA99DRAFT_531685 [Phascolomyces articulosus]|uniref:Uncharacterized protein n=1 Tax=Phascolomyces articulosus TaxID=60185 RepID=A0AAD5L0V6_9FUNG|nr:hypothetical protein BDA99DRAFT_531685 [Phascolomyces articulosus]